MAVLERMASTSGSLTLTNTPGADEFVIVTLGYRGPIPESTSDVSGGGATWAKLYDHLIGPSTYNQDVEVWVGTNFTNADPITCVAYGTVYMTAFHISDGDVNGVVVERDPAFADGEGGSGSLTGPETIAGPGDVVIGHIGSRWTYPAVVPDVMVPSAGWSTVEVSPEIGGWQKFWTLYREPTVSETHNLQTSTANPPASVLQILIPSTAGELPAPPAPRNLSAFDVTDVTASVFWTGFAEGSEEEPAIRYEYTVNGGSVIDNLLSTQVDLTGLTKSTQYVFQVRAVGAQAASDWSEITFTTTAGAPAVPTALNVHTITNVSAVAEWLAGSGGPAVISFEYQIDTRPIETVGAQVFSASISGLSSNTEYTLRVRAVGDDGVSDWVEVLFTTFGPPAIPTGLMMSSITATSATANWTKSPTGTNYQYQVDDGVVVTLGDVATVDLIELASATDHIFAVRAQNQYGSSSWVSTTFQTVEGLPDPPSGLYLSSSTSTSVTAAWYAPVSGSAPTGYEYQLDNGSWFDVPSGLRTVTVDGMLPGSQHTLRVRSKNAVGVSSAASTSFTLNPGSPEAPVDVFATQITETSATVKWAPSVSGPPVSGYEYSLDYSAVMDAGLVQQIFLEGMQPNSTHVFRVRGVGEFGVSEWSEVSFTTNAPDEPEPETARIKWNDAGQRFFENGIDRGVLYLTDGSGVAWNGLTGLDEDLGDESTEPFYMDGEKYHDAVMMGDFAGSLRALMYPDEFLQFEGYGTIGQGVYADDQAVNIFALSYRTLIGNDTQGDNMGYKLHIVYNLSAYPDAKVHSTASDSPSLTEFGWNITSVPVHISGHRPTAHIILDSRYMNSFVLRGIEDILYGDGTVQARLPSISELIEFIDNFTFIQIFDNGDGTWTARGPDALIEMMDATTFMIAEANATFLDEDTYTIRDS